MGFLTRFLSLRRKEKPSSGKGSKGDGSQTGRQTPVLVIASRFSRDANPAKYSTSRSAGSMDILRTRPSAGRGGERKDASPEPDNGEAEINRLLRSSSTHFNIISQRIERQTNPVKAGEDVFVVERIRGKNEKSAQRIC